MDAQRTSFVLTIAALFAGPALAAPPSESAPVRYPANDWSSAGPTTAPTITASPNSRYGYPQPTTRTQTTANNVNAAAPQSYGTAAYPSQPSNNPFATSQPAAPPANTATRSNLAPPPWPTNTSSTPAPPPTTSWGSSTPVTPVDRSLLTNPSAPQSTGDWSSIGSTIAAPPMLLPQSPSSTNSLAPLNTTSFDNGPSFTTNSYPGTQPSFGSSANSTPQSSPAPTSRPAPTSDSWAGSWDGSANNNSASIGSSTNNSSRPVATRDSDFPNSRIATNPQDTRSTPARTDSWTDDWSRNSQSPGGPSASIGGSKPATIGSASNSAPTIQAPLNAPPLAPPTIGSAGNNTNFNGPNPYAPQQPIAVNAAKPTQAVTTNGEPQQWATLLAAILGLAGSLAGNGWSYMDARQKYQALVRRTADTFRRTKVAA